jgi:hypothetical protein
MYIEIKSNVPMGKAAFNRKKTLFTRKLDLSTRKKLVKCYICMVLELGHYRKQIRNTYRILKCCAGEGCRRAVGLNVLEMG